MSKKRFLPISPSFIVMIYLYICKIYKNIFNSPLSRLNRIRNRFEKIPQTQKFNILFFTSHDLEKPNSLTLHGLGIRLKSKKGLSDDFFQSSY